MTLPNGLIPVFVFVLTLGIAVPVTVGSHLLYRKSNKPFSSALRVALLLAGILYLVGTVVVWSVAGGLELWEIPITLLITGVVSQIVLMVAPLLVGRYVIEQCCGAESEVALRFATYGWPIAMLAVFGVFIAPGGVTHGDLLSLGGTRICVAGFCGISLPFAVAVVLEIGIAVTVPALVGGLLYTSAVGKRTQSARS